MGSASVPSQSVCVSPAPRLKRPRLEAVKRLNFGLDEMEESLPPDSPPQHITPPQSPEVPAELWGKGCVPGGLERISFLGQSPEIWSWAPVGGLVS